MPNIMKWAEEKLRGKPKATVVRQKIQDPREKKVSIVTPVVSKVEPKVEPKVVSEVKPKVKPKSVPLVPPKVMTKILTRQERLRKIMEEEY